MRKSKNNDMRFWKVYAHYRVDDSPLEYFAAAKSAKEVREKIFANVPLLKVFAVVEVTPEEYWQSKGIKK